MSSSTDGLKVDIRKLSLINEMAKVGTNGVAENLSKLTGEDARMRVTKTNFVDAADIPNQVEDGDAKRVGVRIRLLEAPHGHLLILFPEESAKKITYLMLSDMVDDVASVSGDMARSAVEELGMMMGNGFVTGWADVLGKTIDTATPQLVYAPLSEVIERTAELGGQDLALVFDSSLNVPRYEIEVELYAFPDIEEFVSMINEIDLEATPA